MRTLIDLAYTVRRRAMAVLGVKTRGVKVLAFDETGALMLIRNRYGRSDLWVLPGGGVERGEASIAAACRELREETGCVLVDAAVRDTLESRSEGRRDTVYVVHGTTRDCPVADGIEVAEARFFALDALPAAVSPATMRRIDELAGRRMGDGRW